MSTGRAILIVGAVGVGVFVLMKALAPKPAAANPRGQSAATAGGNPLMALISGIGGAIGSSSASKAEIDQAYKAGEFQAYAQQEEQSGSAAGVGLTVFDTLGFF